MLQEYAQCPSSTVVENANSLSSLGQFTKIRKEAKHITIPPAPLSGGSGCGTWIRGYPGAHLGASEMVWTVCSSKQFESEQPPFDG